jgi:hypothetical protein
MKFCQFVPWEMKKDIFLLMKEHFQRKKQLDVGELYVYKWMDD